MSRNPAPLPELQRDVERAKRDKPEAAWKDKLAHEALAKLRRVDPELADEYQKRQGERRRRPRNS